MTAALPRRLLVLLLCFVVRIAQDFCAAQKTLSSPDEIIATVRGYGAGQIFVCSVVDELFLE